MRLLSWLLLVGGSGFAVWRAALAIHWLRLWLEWRVTDPSGAELYEVNLWFEAGWTVIALALGCVGLVLIRRARRGPA